MGIETDTGLASRQVHWSVAALQNRLFGVVAVLAMLMIGFSIFVPRFGTVSNLNTIVLNASILAIVAVGEATVILTQNIDASVASIVALSSFIGFDLIARFPDVGPIMILVPVLVGAACGAINGFLVGYAKVPWVIVTLGTMSIYRGLATIYAKGGQIEPHQVPEWAKQSVTGSLPFGVSALLVIAVVIVVAAAGFLRFSRLGRKIYAVGSNPSAASYFGLNRPKVVFQAYVITGALTGIAGFLFGARASYVTPYYGVGMEITAIGAALIGGISFLGGAGSVIGAAVGAVVMATIDNGIVLLGSPEFVRRLINGGLIVVAVVLDAIIVRRVRSVLKTRRRRGEAA